MKKKMKKKKRGGSKLQIYTELSICTSAQTSSSENTRLLPKVQQMLNLTNNLLWR